MSSLVLKMPAPNPKQQAAFRSRKRYVGYGGARGGGKSWFVRWKAVLLCLKYAGIKILITRCTYPELENNHIVPLKELLHCDSKDKRERIAKYNDNKKKITFPNGSTIKFGYCNADNDLGQYQGAEYDVWFADEAGQMREEWLKKINACVRGTHIGFPRQTFFTLNPGGQSHGYFKRLFIDGKFEEGEYPEDYDFVQALVTDNKALMAAQPEYIRSLESLPPKLRDAWLHGRWDVYEGQFFEDFREEPDLELCKEAGITQEEAKQQKRFVHVIDAFDIPSGWKIYRSFDWGYHRPFSCAWWAVDYDGILYRIMELYGCTKTANEGVRWTPDQVFIRIHKVESEHPWLVGKHITGIADPAIWDAQYGDSINDTAARHQVYFQPGDHKRLPGWMQCHYRLQFDESGYPRMYVFRSCKDFIRTVPKMIYDDHNPEDIDTDLEDHICDEWRYMCMSRPVKPLAPVKEQTILNDPLNMFGDKRRKRYGV